MREISRRQLVASLGGTAALGALAGCAGATGPGTETAVDADIVAGPDARNVFEPAEFTASVGDTVSWYFAGPGHNVSAVPDHGGQVSIPDGADPFASYGADGNPNQTDPQDSTYEHTFETAGEYTYVCVPHQRVGMVATVVVEE